MGGGGMSAILTHARIRFLAVLRDPSAVVVMLCTGLATYALWPQPMGPSGPRWEFRPGQLEPVGIATMLIFFWLWLWPMLAATAVGGRSSHPGRLGAFQQVYPPLPVSTRGRLFAEIGVLFLFVLLVRVPGAFLGGFLHDFLGLPGSFEGTAAYALRYAVSTLVGAAIMLPTVVAWTTPARSLNLLFARATAVALLEIVAMWLGLLATVPLAVATGLILSLVQLPLVGREWHVRSPRLSRGEARLARPYRPPQRQLVRDFCLWPLPLTAALLMYQALLVAADRLVLPEVHLLGEDSPGLLYLGSMVALTIGFGFVVLRPLGSNQALAGLVGKTGYRPGDMAGAWAAVPVRRHVLLRGVYLHGLLTTGLLWVAAVSTPVVSLWLERGVLDLGGRQGATIRDLLVPFVAVVPCIAGMLAASAAGSKGKAIVAALMMVLVLQGHPALLMLRVPTAIRAVLLLVAAALGGLPVLPELRVTMPARGTP